MIERRYNSKGAFGEGQALEVETAQRRALESAKDVPPLLTFYRHQQDWKRELAGPDFPLAPSIGAEISE